MEAVDIDIRLKARNSSGEQDLWLVKYGDEYYFTLCGVFDDQHIQIDFEEMTREKLEELKLQIELILGE